VHSPCVCGAYAVVWHAGYGWGHSVAAATRSRLLQRWGIGRKNYVQLLCVCCCLAYPQQACYLWLGSLRSSHHAQQTNAQVRGLREDMCGCAASGVVWHAVAADYCTGAGLQEAMCAAAVCLLCICCFVLGGCCWLGSQCSSHHAQNE
jgi:hypothetical protein